MSRPGRGPGRADGITIAEAACHARAMLAGPMSLEDATRRLVGLLGAGMPSGPERHEGLVDRLAESLPGQRSAAIDGERLPMMIDALRGFRHVAAHACDRFDEDRAAVDPD